MIFNTKATQKNAGQKLTDHYLLNELWSDLDETSQAAVSGGNGEVNAYCNFNETPPRKGQLEIPPGKNLIIYGAAAPGQRDDFDFLSDGLSQPEGVYFHSRRDTPPYSSSNCVMPLKEQFAKGDKIDDFQY